MTSEDVWVAAAYFVAIVGGGPIVALALRWAVHGDDRAAIRSFQQSGLRLGGAMIGGLERLLILTFVLSSEYGAIGLVLAAKGLIRYGEIKEASRQKVAEYVLIGTMMSMVWALIVGLTLRRFLP